MSTITKSSENSRCRLCSHSKPYLASIFRRNISVKIMELADIEVMESDGLPTVVCIECENSVERCYNFRSQVQWADKMFREELLDSMLEVEECNIKEEHGSFMEEEECGTFHSDDDHHDADDASYTENTQQKVQDEPVIPMNHVEIMETHEPMNEDRMIDDPQGQAEPLIEVPVAVKEEERLFDPLICKTEEDLSMEANNSIATQNLAPSTLVCKESPLKKHLNHIQGLKKVIKTKVCKERLLKKHLKHIHGLKKVVKTKVSKNLKVNNASKIMSSKYSNNFKSHNKKRIILKNNATKSAEVDSNIYENKEFSNQNNKKKMAANEDIDTKSNVICLQSMQCDVSRQKHSLKASSYSRAEFGEPSKHSKKVHKANVIFSENSKSYNSSYISEDQLTNNFQHSICLNGDYLNGAVRREEIPLSGEEEEEEISVCSICQKEFNSLYGLRLHNKIVHTVAIALECTVCKEVFQTNKLLSNHISRCHNMRNALLSKNDFLCPKCGLVVKSRASLHRHNKRFHVDIPAKIMCDICGKVFKFTSHLTSHKNFMHPTESDKVTCHVCSKEFVCQVRLKKHMRTTHCETRKYICEHCQRAFKDKKTLDVHRVTHCNESPFKCDICEKTFRTKYKLNTHLTSHSVEQFKCTICYRLFVSDANLRIHIEKSHNNDTQGFHCEICDKDISTKSQYDLHLQFHSDPDMQMFECDLCGKCFESKVKCQRHRLYHDIDNKERQCSVCNKTFKNNKILKHHMFLHSSDAFLYKCSICDKTFRHSSAFSSHQRVHSDKYYYECNLCNEKFKWKQTYDKHVQKCVIKLDIGKSEDQDSKTDGCKGMPESSAAFTWCFDPS